MSRSVPRRERDKEADAVLDGAVLRRTMRAVDGARSVAEYTLSPPGDRGTRLVFMDGPAVDDRRVAVLGEYSLRGLVSHAGCGLCWFTLPRSDYDLCRAFLQRTWVPERAAEVLLERALEALDDARELEQQSCYAAQAEAVERFRLLDRALLDHEEDEATGWCRSDWAFYDFLTDELHEDGEDVVRGRDFDPEDAARLCAVQRKFAALLSDLLWAEQRAAEDELLAREGPLVCAALGC